MSNGWPAIDFGHTGMEAAFGRGDVYAVAPDPLRAGKRPLRLAIAGAGGVAQAKWIPAIRRLQTMGEPVEIAGIADPRAEVAAKAARLAGATPHADVAAMLDAERPDLLLVLTADAAHVDVARSAIARGVPCLVEKPLAPGFDAARALVRAAEGAAMRWRRRWWRKAGCTGRPPSSPASSRSATPMSISSMAARSISSTSRSGSWARWPSSMRAA
ncbi:MAG: Gfo/Idh/MocA family oxidoreductase [Rhizobiales bacterium]|nr:Gfo/Idh/MocA family oxidoreductase [Hyphomicrobiales bacterium]